MNTTTYLHFNGNCRTAMAFYREQDGTVPVPPSDMPSGRFGMCDDSFGISWILNYAKAS